MSQHRKIASDTRIAAHSLVPTDEPRPHESAGTTKTLPRAPYNNSRSEDQGFITPRNNTERVILDIWANALGQTEIGITDDFFELGGSSIAALEIMMDIENVFKVEFPVDVLFNKRTVVALARAVDDLVSVSDRDSLIVPIQPQGSRRAFFACPGHNGDVYCYVQLARHLGADQPFYALQPPGIRGRAACPDKIESLASLYVKQLLAFQEQGPFLLGGFCLGGTIAFEVAQQLQASGRDVAFLVFFGCACPTSFSLPNRILTKLNFGTRRVVYHLRTARRLSMNERLAYITDTVRRQRPGRSAPANRVVPRQTPHQIAVGRTSVLAARHYRRKMQPYDGRITLFLPSRGWIGTGDRPMDWQRFAKRGVETFLGPEHSHVDRMLLEPDVQIFARELRLRLDQLETVDAPAVRQ